MAYFEAVAAGADSEVGCSSIVAEKIKFVSSYVIWNDLFAQYERLPDGHFEAEEEALAVDDGAQSMVFRTL